MDKVDHHNDKQWGQQQPGGGGVKVRGGQEELTRHGTAWRWDERTNDTRTTEIYEARLRAITQTTLLHGTDGTSSSSSRPLQHHGGGKGTTTHHHHHYRGLQLQGDEGGNDEDSEAVQRLVALQQRLNLTDAERAQLRAQVRDTALAMIRASSASPSSAASAITTRDSLLLSPLIDLLQQQQQQSRQQSPLLPGLTSSPLRANEGEDTNSSTGGGQEEEEGAKDNTTNNKEDNRDELLFFRQRQQLQPGGGASEQLGLSSEDRDRLRAAIRDAAIALIRQAAQQEQQQPQQAGVVANLPGNLRIRNDNNNYYKASGGGVLSSLSTRLRGSDRQQGEEGAWSSKASEQQPKPDGGVLINPHSPTTAGSSGPSHTRRLPSSSASSTEDPSPAVLLVLPRADGPVMSALNLTDAERVKLRHAVRDVAVSLIKQAAAAEDDQEDGSKDQERRGGAAAILSAVRTAATGGDKQQQQHKKEDLLFHHSTSSSSSNHEHHRQLPIITAGQQPQPEQQPSSSAVGGGALLSSRLDSTLTDAEKAQLKAAIRAAALAILREAAAQEFGTKYV